MGFSADPYEEMTVAFSRTSRAIEWECSSCGGRSKRAFEPSEPIGDIIVDWHVHVRMSHYVLSTDLSHKG